MTIFSYDPKEVTLIVGAFHITGFAEDDFIDVERDEDAFTKKVGVSGEVGRMQNANITGHVIFSLMQSSISNDALSLLAALDQGQGVGAVPVTCRDLSGRSVFASPFAWVKKYPKAGWKKDVSNWVWTLDTAAMLIYMGGQNA